MLLKLQQVSETLNCSLSTVYNLCATGKLRSVRIGAGGAGIRVRPEDLQAFIDESVAGPPSSKHPKKVGAPFKNLDGERLRAAWRRQGISAPSD